MFRKEIPGYRASNLYFLKYKIGSLLNIKDVESENNGQRYLQMRLFVFYCQVLGFQGSMSKEKIHPPPPLRAP